MMLSVVLCTHNRAAILREALESLALQTPITVPYEVLVVDNASTDDTEAVATAYAERLPLRYLPEPQLGVSYARNTGYRRARGEYIVYLDDDAKAPPHWLATIVRYLTTQEIDILGGPFVPYYQQPKPRWFKDEYAAYVPLTESRFVRRGEYMPVGGNMTLRRSLLEARNGFHTGIGMCGRKTGYGEEPELIEALWERNPDLRVFYAYDTCVEHLVAPYKYSLWWWLRAALAHGKSFVERERLKGEAPADASWTIGRRLLAKSAHYLLRVARAAIWRNRRQHPALQNFLIAGSWWLTEIAMEYHRLRQPRAGDGGIR